MLKMIGAFLLTGGCIGYGLSLNITMRRAEAEMKEFIYIFQMMKSDISYRKETLPQACCHTGKKVGKKIGEFLLKAAMKTEQEREHSFAYHWKREGEQYFKDSVLPKAEQKLILNFPEYTGFSDEQMQITVLEEFISELSDKRADMDICMKDRQRVVMGLSTVSGLVLTILLL